MCSVECTIASVAHSSGASCLSTTVLARMPDAATSTRQQHSTGTERDTTATHDQPIQTYTHLTQHRRFLACRCVCVRACVCVRVCVALCGEAMCCPIRPPLCPARSAPLRLARRVPPAGECGRNRRGKGGRGVERDTWRVGWLKHFMVPSSHAESWSDGRDGARLPFDAHLTGRPRAPTALSQAPHRSPTPREGSADASVSARSVSSQAISTRTWMCARW